MKFRCPSAQGWWAFFVAVFTGLLTLVTFWQYQLGKNAAALDVAFLSPTEPQIDGDKGTMTMYLANWGREVSGAGVITLYCAVVKRDDLTIYARGGFFRHPLTQIPPFQETGPHILPSFPVMLVPWSSDQRKDLENNTVMIVMMGRIEYDNRQKIVQNGFCWQSEYVGPLHTFVWQFCGKETVSKLRSEEQEIEKQQQTQQ